MAESNPPPAAAPPTGPGNALNERTYQEVEYLKRNLGPILVAALAEICIRRPADPIEYLGHWLLRWRYNEELKRRDVQNALEVVRNKTWNDKESEQGSINPNEPEVPPAPETFAEGFVPDHPYAAPGFGGPLNEEQLKSILGPDGRPSAAPQDGRPSAAVPQDGHPSAAVPQDGRPSAAVPQDGRPSAAVPQDGRPSAAVPQDGRPSAAVPQDGRPSSLPQNANAPRQSERPAGDVPPSVDPVRPSVAPGAERKSGQGEPPRPSAVSDGMAPKRESLGRGGSNQAVHEQTIKKVSVKDGDKKMSIKGETPPE